MGRRVPGSYPLQVITSAGRGGGLPIMARQRGIKRSRNRINIFLLWGQNKQNAPVGYPPGLGKVESISLYRLPITAVG